MKKRYQYDDWGGMPGCKGCQVFDFILCPLMERAHGKGIKIERCDVLRPFGEQIISSIERGGRRAWKKDTITE